MSISENRVVLKLENHDKPLDFEVPYFQTTPSGDLQLPGQIGGG